jgi:hypothetical protein
MRGIGCHIDAIAREQIAIALRVEPVARLRRAGGDDELPRRQRVDDTIGHTADGKQEQRRGDGDEREFPPQQPNQVAGSPITPLHFAWPAAYRPVWFRHASSDRVLITLISRSLIEISN